MRPDTLSLYDPRFVRGLFDEMSQTYGAMNYVSSLGFCERWRERCVAMADLEPGMEVYDLMTGMGECWPLIARRLNGSGRIVGVDISPEMCVRARQMGARLPDQPTDVLEADVLLADLSPNQADRVVSAFGLKTFSPDQQRVLAQRIAWLLKPGGTFSLLEISVPRARLLHAPYMAYLKRGVPLLGRLFLGNPDNYRLLGIYTERFENSRTVADALADNGLAVAYHELFWGCATVLTGRKSS